MAELTQEHRDRIELLCLALESGKYRQGKNQLRSLDNKRYCCLGVACHISKVGWWQKGNYIVDESDSSAGLLPKGVARFFGFDSTSPHVKTEMMSRDSLPFLNDTAGYTFPQIAAAIRRTYLEAK